jgi:hypothetical protein
MHMQCVIVAAAVSVPLWLGAQRDACSLLTPAEVSAAIESTSLPGKRLSPSDPRHCLWTDSPTITVSNRRVTLTILRPGAYDLGKGGVAGASVKIEPVSGIGDDAYYQLSSGSPYLTVRKGGTDFQVQILNGMNFKVLTLAQEKAKEVDLAKAAVAKL